MATYGLSSWLCARLPLTEALEALTDAGFTQVELSDEQSSLVQAWEADPVALVAQAREVGIRVRSVHTPEAGRFLDVADEARRVDSVAANLRYLDLMAASGVPDLIVHPTSGAPGSDVTAYRAAIHKSLETLSAAAAERGLRLDVENLPWQACAIADVLQMIAACGDHVGVCHDVGHSVQSHLDPVAETRLALRSGRLFSLHLHDVDATLKDHYLPGEGTVALPGILAALDDSGFAGLRTLEIARAEEGVAERVAQAGQVRAQWEGRG